MLSRSLGMPSLNNGPPSIWDTHGTSGKFLQIQRCVPQHLIRKSPIHGSPMWSEHTAAHVMSESQTPIRDQRCQSGPSARNSLNPSEGRFLNDYGADQQRLQISDPLLDTFTKPATFAWWKIRFKTEVSTC